MNRRVFPVVMTLVFAVEISVLLVFAVKEEDFSSDVVSVNEVVQSVRLDWDNMERHKNQTKLDYVVLDAQENVIFKTREGLNESIHQAILNRDTILEIEAGDKAGTVFIYNDSAAIFQKQKKTVCLTLAAAILLQCILCIGYAVYLNYIVIKPFDRLKEFAGRIADGNFDIPLKMDRINLFGAFTESFDIMRTELKRAQAAEARANAEKKELTAKLSHDIKTPVASIKAASELGIALTDNVKTKDNYRQIISKADQINALITNLFTAAMEELTQLSVVPLDLESSVLKILLENADYLHYAKIPDIPDCLLYADRLRLQQVFDNIFFNSYKYANTQIEVTVFMKNECLFVCIEDYGGGVEADELPYLKEKYKRGSNTKDVEGAGLGLYLADYFLREMQGALEIQNGRNGLRVTAGISLSVSAAGDK